VVHHIGAFIKHIIITSTINTPNTTKKDCFPRRNSRQDSFNLRLTRKNNNQNNTSVRPLGHYSIFTLQRRSKHTSLISMSGGQKEWDTTLAKAGSTSQDQGGNNGDTNDYSNGYIYNNSKDNFNGEPEKTP